MQYIIERINWLTSYDNLGALRSVAISFPVVLTAIIIYWIARRVWHKYKGNTAQKHCLNS